MTPLLVRQFFFWVLLLVLLLGLIIARSNEAGLKTDKAILFQHPAPLLLDIAVSGPLPGVMADFEILKMFSIYHEASKDSFTGDKKALWEIMANTLTRAQRMDPRFFDTYRLAGSLLAYDANMPDRAVEILSQGISYHDSWELPFYAGFIAHDKLRDDELAFRLMSEAINMPDTPDLIIGLCSRFLKSAKGDKETLIFLEGLRRNMPERYRKGIERRILELKEGGYSR